MSLIDTFLMHAPADAPSQTARRLVESVLRKASGRAILSAPPHLSVVPRGRAADLRSTSETSQPASNRVVLLLASTSSCESWDLKATVERMGSVAMLVSNRDLSMAWLKEYAPKISMVVVDGDSLGDAEDMVDRLMALREAVPDLPVVLLTTGVATDDLSAGRRMICDATLRKPVSPFALERGTGAALDNHCAKRPVGFVSARRSVDTPNYDPLILTDPL